jgi:ubiquinone/menaquinone biosynthesis C-methylase UbiE
MPLTAHSNAAQYPSQIMNTAAERSAASNCGEPAMASPETEQLTRMMASAALTRGICTLAELGVADHIQSGTPEPVAKLAQLTGAHEDALYRVMRFTSSYGVFRETAQRAFDHSRLSAVLRTDAEGSFRPAARMMHHIFPAWSGVHHAVRTGGLSFQQVFGKPLFGYLGEHQELAPIFDAGMTAFHGHETAAMLEAYDFSDIQTLADVGGGNGSMIAAVLQRYPRLNGILYDLGHVIGRAKATIQARGLERRCAIVEGNFFEAAPPGADAYLMRHVLHDWTDEQCVEILRNCRKVVPAHGRVLVVEVALSPPNEASLGKDMDMIMLAFPGGKERSEEEYRALFESAGFRLSKVTPTQSGVCVVEGRPT